MKGRTLLWIVMGKREYILAIMLALLLNGCAAPHLDLSFKSSFPGTVQPTGVSGIVGVAPFIDLRPQAHGSEDEKWLGMIPGMLWLEIGTDIPEIYMAFSAFNAQPISDSMAEAVADLMGQALGADSVVYLPKNPRAKVDYYLEGKVRRTLVKETGYYYGSFIYAWATRIFGLPYVSYDVSMELELALRSADSGDILWQDRLQGQREDKYNTVYRLANGRNGKHVIAYNFSELLAEEFAAILPGLQVALSRD